MTTAEQTGKKLLRNVVWVQRFKVYEKVIEDCDMYTSMHLHSLLGVVTSGYRYNKESLEVLAEEGVIGLSTLGPIAA